MAKNKRGFLALGLMSGTSADGLTVCAFDARRRKIGCFKNYPYSKKLQDKILGALNCKAPALSALNFELGLLYADTVAKFIKEFKIKKEDILVIGSHGQTVFHNPQDKFPNTLQIGEAAFLAQRFNVPVVYNFRAADIAVCGSGAPLMPAFDEFLFGSAAPQLLLNIGGISNVALTGAGLKTFGFDIGPGNVMIDAAVNLLSKGRLKFDKDGRLGAFCPPDVKKAQSLLKLFIGPRPPLSLERSSYAEPFIKTHFPAPDKKDISTITYLTALIIAKSIEKFILNKQKNRKARLLIVSGGGVYNKTLIKFLSSLLKGVKVISLEQAGIHPMAKEAAAFAYFAWRTLEGKPSSCPSATGAKRKVILGALYPAVK